MPGSFSATFVHTPLCSRGCDTVFWLALGHRVALYVAALSLSVLLFGLCEALEADPLDPQLCERSPCHVFHTRHRVALSVLLFGVYEALECDPLVSQLRVCSPGHVFHTRHGMALPVPLLGLYEVLESGPLLSLLI